MKDTTSLDVSIAACLYVIEIEHMLPNGSDVPFGSITIPADAISESISANCGITEVIASQSLIYPKLPLRIGGPDQPAMRRGILKSNGEYITRFIEFRYYTKQVVFAISAIHAVRRKVDHATIGKPPRLRVW